MAFLFGLMSGSAVCAQTAPSLSEQAGYTGLHAAALKGDVEMIKRLAKSGANLEARDEAGRTPLHVATFKSHDAAVKALVEAGANPNALEYSKYDIVTIAAVADDVELVKLALSLGASAKNITSPYDGTALIAAAHLGHVEVVKALIKGGAPLDHVNNLRWTALIESVVLGDGGPRHVATARALLKAGADRTIPDGAGVTPLMHAKGRGYREMIKAFEEIKK